jgi:UDPglucose--hexose-1-phosphate uridylyltransferase
MRKDPLFSRWIAVLKDSKSPEEYEPTPPKDASGPCPLCAGGDAEALKEVESVGSAGKDKRIVRAVKAPLQVLVAEGGLGRKGVGMYDKMNSIGVDEIIIESPEHQVMPEDLGAEHFTSVIQLYRNRVAAIEDDKRVRYVILCKDSDKRAGAPYSHPHARVIGMPVIPLRIKTELDGAKEYYAYKDRCLFCDIVDEELRFSERLIMESEHFLAFCPFAPKYPFEFWIIPKRHECAFKEITGDEVQDLGLLMSALLKKMRKVLGEPPFSYTVHSSPNMIPRRDRWHTLGDDFHWHIEVMPRLKRTSGVETGSGFYILSTSPENAAIYLKEG